MIRYRYCDGVDFCAVGKKLFDGGCPQEVLERAYTTSICNFIDSRSLETLKKAQDKNDEGHFKAAMRVLDEAELDWKQLAIEFVAGVSSYFGED